MTTTTFVDRVTPIMASWLNDVDAATYRGTVSYIPPGGVSRTVANKFTETVSVIDFGADPTGVADSTAAFNLATMATTVHGGNSDTAMKRCIRVPAGSYKINGTVYVRKGQHLLGDGQGASYITVPSGSSGIVSFMMGKGLISGVATDDAGGLAPVISGIFVIGGDSAGSVINAGGSSGYVIRDVFLTSAGVGIAANGGDGLIENCFLDQGLVGIATAGQNILINHCLFYNLNYGIIAQTGTVDTHITDCHFEYGQYVNIQFQAGAGVIKNVSITGCQFVTNAQYATKVADIETQANSLDVSIRGCNFRNNYGYSIVNSTGLAGRILISDCVFDGLITTASYTQSTTAKAISMQNHDVDVKNCIFRNMFASPISWAGSSGSYTLRINGCRWETITGGANLVTISATAGAFVAVDNEGDDVSPLVNLQSALAVTLRRNRRWLGPSITGGGRIGWKIPTQGSSMARVTVKGNPLLVGNPAYSKVSQYRIIRYVDYNGAAVADYAVADLEYQSPAGTSGVITVTPDLDTIGGGTTGVAYVNLARYLVFSIPNTITNPTVEVDMLQ